MDLESLFQVVNLSTTPAWLLLVVAPGWKWTDRIAHSVFMPLLLGTAYAVLLFTDMGAGGEGNFFSLTGVMAIFARPQTTIAAWIHYLVFDLFIGAWQVRDARRRGLHHGWVVPGLLLTFAFGPVGLVVYLVIRGFKLRVATLAEQG